jgi:DNA repair and recombination RAD54-like protein
LANDGGHPAKGKSNKCASFTPEELRDCFTLKQGCKCDTKNKLGKKWSDYAGVSSLHEQGCTDQPLLAVCEDLVDTLSFVRVVDDESATDNVEPVESNDSFFASDGDFDSSSEEEEFDG